MNNTENKIKIVADSSADLTALRDIPFAVAPLKIVTQNKEYIDDDALDVTGMVEEMHRYNGKSSTSCPNVGDWLNAFGDAEEIFCITITSGLSGSYNAACAAKAEYEKEHPTRRVTVIDSLSAGPEIALIAERIRKMVLDGKSFDEIEKALPRYKTALLFVLESMKNLANNGRVSKLAATAAGILGIRAVGRASDMGTLELLDKCRGGKKAIEAVVCHMKKMGFSGGRAIISHCLNKIAASELAEKIRAAFPPARVDIRECRGLCSFYAEKGGMLIGFEA